MPFLLFGRRPKGAAVATIAACAIAFAAMLAGELVRRGHLDAQAALVAAVQEAAEAPRREGAILRASGPVTATEPVRDPDTGLAVPAVLLRREVQGWLAFPALGAAQESDGRRGVWLAASADALARGAWPRSLVTAEFLPADLAVGGVPVGAGFAALLPVLARQPVAEAAEQALAARFPAHHLAREEGWVVLSERAGERRDGDLRIAYGALPSLPPLTLIGVWRDGRLEPAGPEYGRPVPGDRPAREAVPRALEAAGEEARLYGRGAGFLVLGVMAAVLVMRAARAEAKARGERESALDAAARNPLLRDAAAMLLLAAALPLWAVLMILAWAATTGPVAAAVVAAVLLAAAAGWLLLESRPA